LTIDGSKLGADAATKITALEALVYDDTATGMPAPEDILDIFLA
jgi:hypothetical protein